MIAIIISVLVITLAMPMVSNAEVKGSTQFLINQAKYYEGDTLAGTKADIKAQGYNGWNMSYEYDWCAWYLSNCANCAYIGNYPGNTSIPKNTFVDQLASNFAKFNGTSKKYPSSYSPKAGDIVVENGEGHIGIMISASKAAYGNDGTANWQYTTAKIRAPHNVDYYIPRPNWYMIHYSDGLSSTSVSSDMEKIAPVKATFGVAKQTSTKKFTRKGYHYSYVNIFRQDYNKSKNTYTNYYWMKNKKTGKKSWQKAGTKGYTKVKFKVGFKLLYTYNSRFAGAKVVLTPVWVKN